MASGARGANWNPDRDSIASRTRWTISQNTALSTDCGAERPTAERTRCSTVVPSTMRPLASSSMEAARSSSARCKGGAPSAASR